MNDADLLSSIWAQPEAFPVLSPAQWETLLGQARTGALLARLAHLFAARHWLPAVPAAPRGYLEGALRLADRQRHEVQWEVDCIRRALRGVDTPVVLLKGAAYLIAGLPAARGRLFADIDILVRQERLPDAEGALFRAGWISEERDAYNQRYYRQWMHEIPPLTHIHRHTVIDVHHTIAPPTSRFKVDARKLLQRIRPVPGWDGLYILGPTDMVLHSAVHLFQEGEFGHGLRDLLDLNDLVLFFADEEPGFWPELFSRAAELGLQTPLFHALQHLRRLFHTDVPADCQAARRAIEPNWFTRSVVSALLASALRPKHPSCDSLGNRWARWLLYVRSHHLRMPLYRVVPHLLRKAWMRQFPDKPGEESPAAAG